mmetsp:Transcript_2502/g.3685  ORF Transcript_2502/g.3685 Transcript_2502/m.3685 type:complete len:241 (+) Transcript_2502:133-855(+)
MQDKKFLETSQIQKYKVKRERDIMIVDARPSRSTSSLQQHNSRDLESGFKPIQKQSSDEIDWHDDENDSCKDFIISPPIDPFILCSPAEIFKHRQDASKTYQRKQGEPILKQRRTNHFSNIFPGVGNFMKARQMQRDSEIHDSVCGGESDDELYTSAPDDQKSEQIIQGTEILTKPFGTHQLTTIKKALQEEVIKTQSPSKKRLAVNTIESCKVLQFVPFTPRLPISDSIPSKIPPPLPI